MFFSRRVLLIILVLSLGLFLTACQDETEKKQDSIFPIFGGGEKNDFSPVIAKVEDVEITQRDLDMRFEELLPPSQLNFEGEEGRQLLLKEMIDETLLVKGALEMGLKNRQDVGRTLVSQRRLTMVSAMRNIGIPEENKLTEDDYQSYFKDNRTQFMQEGLVHARHVECLTLERAQEAYRLIMVDRSAYNFMKVAGDFSVNKATLANNADLGWFNKGGIIENLTHSLIFINAVFDFEVGVHRPIQVKDRWHVVEIFEHQHARPMTYVEAYELVKSRMTPAFYDGKIKDYLLDMRKRKTVEMFGQYAPGNGQGPEAIMKRASLVADPGVKLDYYRMVYTDFPQSDRADDALFMCALVTMDTWQDRRMAQRYLDRFIEEFPESELYEDVVFLKENLYNPGGVVPQTIDDLKK